MTRFRPYDDEPPPTSGPDASDLSLSRGTDFLGFEAELSAEDRAVRDRVREFCDGIDRSLVTDAWHMAEPLFELRDAYADLGIAGGTEQGYGCPGLSPVATGLAMMELARCDGSLSTLHMVHSGFAMNALSAFGDEEQKQRLLPGLARGERLGAFALTEPSYGSDYAKLEATAVVEGSQIVLNGTKRWIGNGAIADVVVVMARDEDGGLGAYVIEDPNRLARPAPGWSAEPIIKKTALRGLWQSHIRMEDVRIPVTNRLAHMHSIDDVFRLQTTTRSLVAWQALGHAVGAYEAALAYTLRREQFGRPLAGTQLVQSQLASMLAQITATQALLLQLARVEARGEVTFDQAALAKLHSVRMARSVTAAARDLLGGNGLLIDHVVGVHLADMEAVATYEGTDSINALLVGRAITGLSAF